MPLAHHRRCVSLPVRGVDTTSFLPAFVGQNALVFDHDWQATFNETFSSPVSAVEQRIWRQVFGDEYPEGLDIYSFVTVSELTRISVDVQLRSGDVLLDMACGRGGPGIWVAAHTGARLVGVDIAATLWPRRKPEPRRRDCRARGFRSVRSMRRGCQMRAWTQRCRLTRCCSHPTRLPL
jgi:hypothetical protein